MSTRHIDVKRTCLQERFFSNFLFDSAEDLLAAVAGMEIDVNSMMRNRDLYGLGYSGWVYWLLYVKGYLQYGETGVISEDNTYYEYLMKYYFPLAYDPGLSWLAADPLAANDRVARRFRDLDLFRNHAARNPSELGKVAPVRVFVSDPPSPETYKLPIYESGSDTPLMADLVDGWHRLFSAKLFGIEMLPYEVVHI
jgi:hypothetical protein